VSVAPSPAAGDLPDFRVDGKVAVVTGATGGIGRGCALALARSGASVVLLSRSKPPLLELADEIHAGGGDAAALPCDASDAEQVRRAFASIARVDVLVNAAGGNQPQPFLEATEDALDWMWSVNVKGSFLVAQQAARRMVRLGRGGSIVNVSSQMGHVGAARRTVYCATKHAVEGMTKAMAVELAPNGIRVNCVAPTFVETPMTRHWLADAEFRADVLRRIPLGRVGAVDDVAAAVLFLASPASGLTTGASLLIDGGWTAQ
jgi:NAD(P)-dependent dehydrogenase (short-subunit alcohol dehydrogenase family)